MLHAVDTNVLARALVDDGSEQGKRATEFVRNNQIFVSDTVLQETEWVLRSQLGLQRSQVKNLMSRLISLENVVFDNLTRTASAMSGYLAGLDFADAMHLLSAEKCDDLVSFDRDFAKRAAKLPGSVPVRQP